MGFSNFEHTLDRCDRYKAAKGGIRWEGGRLMTVDSTTARREYRSVIKSFADKATAAVFAGEQVRRLPRCVFRRETGSRP